MSQSRLRVTQPMKHKVAHDWEDTRHLQDYTPAEEIPVDPTRCSTYQVKCRENGVHGENIVIQTVLMLYAQSWTANTREDPNDDETCNVPVCHDITRPRCMQKVNIARRSNSRCNDTVNHLDQLPQQSGCVSQDHTLENVIRTSELHSINPTFEFNALELYEGKTRHSGNPLHTNATYKPHLREGFMVIISAGVITNGGNAALTGHARSNHAHAQHRPMKEYKLIDHMLTLALTDPTCLIKVCLDMPTGEGQDHRPEHTLTDSADMEVATMSGGQPSSLDVPNNNRRYVLPHNALEQPRSPDELTTCPPISDHHNVVCDDAQQPRHTNSTQTTSTIGDTDDNIGRLDWLQTRYSEEMDAERNPKLGFYMWEWRKDNNSTIWHNDNLSHDSTTNRRTTQHTPR
ncbi:hypothetical protein EDB89DRAFT_2078871 [Lactarius sanguifluus]|nr:hypothetical protein EDB89DRAFT_2078871 [Lactarius sanguifluus]